MFSFALHCCVIASK